jgi:hypothetical protein
LPSVCSWTVPMSAAAAGCPACAAMSAPTSRSAGPPG